jgi:hypothetical protein
MYVNAKMMPVETVSGIKEGGNEGEQCSGQFKYDVFDIL